MDQIPSTRFNLKQGVVYLIFLKITSSLHTYQLHSCLTTYGKTIEQIKPNTFVFASGWSGNLIIKFFKLPTTISNRSGGREHESY